MRKHSRLVAIVGLLILGIPGAGPAWSQCEHLLENPSAPDFEYVGLRSGGSRGWVGQAFITTGAGHFETAAFQVKADLLPLDGIDPLGSGDLLRCTVLDREDRPIASVTSALGSGFSFQWVSFDFAPLELGLVAGPLSVRLSTDLDGFVWVGTSGDLADGNLTLGDESNAFASGSRDTSYRVAWNECTPVVGTETQAWGAVKALFR